MVNSKFYTLFSACSEQEQAGFHKHLRQAHTQKKDAQRWLEYVRKVHGAPDSEARLDLAFCYRKIYRKDIGDYRKQALNILSELHGLLKEYLLSEKIKSDVFESDTLWLSILLEKKMEEEFSRYAHSIQANIDSCSPKSLSAYLNGLILQHLYYYHHNITSAFEGNLMLQRTAEKLQIYSDVLRLRIKAEALYLEREMADSFDPAGLPLLYAPEIERLLEEPLPFLYSELIRLIEIWNDEQFDRFALYIEQYADKVSAKELGELLQFANSYMSIKLRHGERREDILRIHGLNKIAHKNNNNSRENGIMLGFFLNNISIACKSNDYDWARSFAEDCYSYLPTHQRDDALSLTEAIIFIEKREFKKSLKILDKIASKDYHMQIRTKTFMVICYYEIDDPNFDLYAFCTNFELYLKRPGKTIKAAIESVLTVLRIVKMLLRKKADKQQIIDVIQATDKLNLRAWLLEKAKEYKKV